MAGGNSSAAYPSYLHSEEYRRVETALKFRIPLRYVVKRHGVYIPIWQAVRTVIDDKFAETEIPLDPLDVEEYDVGASDAAIYYVLDDDLAGNPESNLFTIEERNALCQRLERYVAPGKDGRLVVGAWNSDPARGKELVPISNKGHLEARFVSPFDSLDDFCTEVELWREDVREQEHKSGFLAGLQQRLDMVTKRLRAVKEAKLIGGVRTLSVTHEAPFRFNGVSGRDVAIEDIFGAAHASSAVPYIHMITPAEENFSRLWERDFHPVVVPPAKKLNTANCIYFQVRTGTEKSEAPRAAEKSEVLRATDFMLIKLNLTSGKAVVKIGGAEDSTHAKKLEALLDAISASCPRLVFDEDRAVAYSGEFLVAATEPLEEYTFLHFVLVDPIANEFLYAEESTKATTERKKLIVRFTNLFGALVEQTTHQKHPFALSAKIASESAGDGVQTRVTFSKAASPADVENFVSIFARLVPMYETQRPALAKIYAGFIDHRSPTAAAENFERPEESSKLSPLEALDKTLFGRGSGYGTECQKVCQPTVTTAEEYEAWLKHKEKRGAVLAFRLERGGGRYEFIYLTSKGNRVNPYISLKLNTLQSSDKYPFLPCCTSSESTQWMVAEYNEYLLLLEDGRVAEAQELVRRLRNIAKGPSRGVVKTQKIKEYGHAGKAKPVISRMMRTVVGSEAEVLLYGVNIGPSAFLACVLKACENDTGLSGIARKALAALPGGGEKAEQSLAALRKEIAKAVHPALLKQELYEFSQEEITRALYAPRDQEQDVLDPSLHFRALEVYFGVNILTLVNRPKAGSTEGKKADEVMIEIPKYRLFHSRLWRYPRTVVIFKHWGNPRKRRVAKVPACELVQTTTSAGAQHIYADESNVALGNIFAAVNQVSRAFPVSVSSPDLAHREVAPYEAVDWKTAVEAIFQSADLRYQLIDSNGKMRALATEREARLYWCFFGPAAPLDLPEMSPDEPPTTEQVSAAIGTRATLAGFTGSDTGDSFNVAGLWYYWKDKEEIWCPARGTFAKRLHPDRSTKLWGVFENVEVPLVSSAMAPYVAPVPSLDSSVRNLEATRLRAVVLKQLIRWVYLLWATESSAGGEGEFGAQYFREGKLGEWDATSAPRNLRAETPADAMVLIGRHLPGLVQDGRFVLPAPLLEKVFSDLNTFARWVQGLCYRTTKGQLAFKVDWPYEVANKKGAQLRGTNEVRGLKKAFVTTHNRLKIYDAEADAEDKASQFEDNAMLADELVGVGARAGAFSTNEGERAFSDNRERNRALIELATDLDFPLPPEWTHTFPWMSASGSLRTTLVPDDFAIKEPFYLEADLSPDVVPGGISGEQPAASVYLVQNIDAEPNTAEARIKNLVWTWAAKGVNLGKEAPPDKTPDLVLEVYGPANGQLVWIRNVGEAARRRKGGEEGATVLPRFKVVEYGLRRYGALLSLDISPASQ